MQDLKLKDHFTKLENEKGGPKRERVETEDHSRSYNKAKHSIVYPTHKSYNYVEKNSAKALKVAMNISSKLVSSYTSHWYKCITICMGVLQRGYPLPMADTVFAQGEQKRACSHGTKAVVFKAGYKHKQTLTNNQSCLRKRDAVLLCATQLHYRQCHCSCEMVFQNPVLYFPKYWSFKLRSCFFQSSIFSAPTYFSRLTASDHDL